MAGTANLEFPAAGEPTVLERILDPAARADPYPLYALLRERPIWREPNGLNVVGRYDDVAALIRDPRMSADPVNSPRGGDPLSFLNMDPPDHDRIRRMTHRYFRAPDGGRLATIAPTLEAIVANLIDACAERGELDIVRDVAYPFPVMVIADLLGVPREDEPRFHAWAEAITQSTDRDPDEPRRRSGSAETAFQELAGYMFGLIRERQAAPRDDMLSRLANDDGPDGQMTPQELVGVSVLLLLAGHETTVNLISNGVLTLLRFPHLLARLREEPGLAPAFVEEVLRYEPPVHFTFRSTLAPIDIGEETIPAGSGVQLMLASANRDPRRFDQPDLFDPDRRNNQHLAFGSGIHACFGAPLARLEGQIAFRELARRLVGPRLLQDPPPYRYNPTLRGPRELRVAVDRIAK